MKALLAGFAVFIALVSAPVGAAEFPQKPVRMVVPYPPGGGTDILARLVAKFLTDVWKQSVIVDNRPGGNGVIGLETVARAAPDGHTLLAVAAGPLDDHNLKYFTPVALFAAPPYLMVVHPSVPANNVKELIALAKTSPGKLNYGSTGGGSASHLSTELFKATAGIDMFHVPYKGIGQATNEILGGQVQVLIGPSQALMPHAKSGKLRPLAITSGKRSNVLPGLPTISETVAGFESYGWFGLAAPAKVPRERVNSINADVRRVLQNAEMKQRFAELGAEPATFTPEEFLQFVRRDNAKWEKLIKQRNIDIERPRINI